MSLLVSAGMRMMQRFVIQMSLISQNAIQMGGPWGDSHQMDNVMSIAENPVGLPICGTQYNDSTAICNSVH